ncbi:MAG: xanthine dehydrogenase family protein subunit M [Dehalobacterium sp.]
MLKVERYFRPGTVKEALEVLTANKSKILSGGTDLVLDLQKKEMPGMIVDIGSLNELQQIRETRDKVILGSGVTFTQVEISPVTKKYCSALSEAAGLVGSPQIRNQGTVGGNIANASPAADTVPAIVAMDGEVLLASLRGERLVKVTDLLKGIGKTDLAADELILEISFNKIANFRSTFVKLGRRNALAISRISAALGVSVNEEGTIYEARAALGSVAPNPFRSKVMENVLLDKNINQGIPEDVIQAAGDDVADRLGTRASAPYKREAVKGVVRQALENLFSKR